jgi:hypothetical protein
MADIQFHAVIGSKIKNIFSRVREPARRNDVRAALPENAPGWTTCPARISE